MLNAAARDEDVVALSAISGEGMATFLEAVSQRLVGLRHETRLVLPFSEGRKRAWLHEEGVIEAEEQTEEGFVLTVLWTDRQEQKFRGL